MKRSYIATTAVALLSLNLAISPASAQEQEQKQYTKADVIEFMNTALGAKDMLYNVRKKISESHVLNDYFSDPTNSASHSLNLECISWKPANEIIDNLPGAFGSPDSFPGIPKDIIVVKGSPDTVSTVFNDLNKTKECVAASIEALQLPDVKRIFIEQASTNEGHAERLYQNTIKDFQNDSQTIEGFIKKLEPFF